MENYCDAWSISNYRILPIKGALPNKGAPHSLEEANSTINVQNTCSFLHNCPIFNPKPPLESLESQLFPHNVKCDLANAPGALIRQNTVSPFSPLPQKFLFPCSMITPNRASWMPPAHHAYSTIWQDIHSKSVNHQFWLVKIFPFLKTCYYHYPSYLRILTFNLFLAPRLGFTLQVFTIPLHFGEIFFCVILLCAVILISPYQSYGDLWM